MKQSEQTTMLEEKLRKYRDIKIEGAFLLEQLATLEKQIKDIVRETGQIAEVEGARITVTMPKQPRVYWDTKALEGFVAAYPKLAKLRSERMPAPSVRIIVD